MEVYPVYYRKFETIDLLEVGTDELVDGGFSNMDEVESYCKEYGYVLNETVEKYK
ncbi:hypothetical protein [Ralstonia phage RSP15]|uniref:hypothetical protein n=1 Tax=Ralstonia phage RSP15 TaxID=1785960 RepID=UPI00074D38F8|nr:hypothetical protein BH754_gp232 [Ralstonia phage RSP15]BAU40074.1 hypothetical protein [Ralstonia phage RSP15]